MARILGLFFALLLIAVCFYATWFLGNAFVDAISAARPEVSAAIIGGMTTIFGGVAAVLLSQAHERNRAAEDAHRLRKVEIYQGFITMVGRMMGANVENLNLVEPEIKELMQYMFHFKSDILLWGSPKVIKAQLQFEHVSQSGESTQILRAVNKIYLAMREDLGLSNAGLNKLELAKLHVKNDAMEHIG
jgi:hypothetical protein